MERYMDLQGYASANRGYTRDCRVIQRIYRGIERFTWVNKDKQGFTEAIEGCTRVYSIPANFF